jgi:hypothetical protein
MVLAVDGGCVADQPQRVLRRLVLLHTAAILYKKFRLLLHFVLRQADSVTRSARLS